MARESVRGKCRACGGEYAKSGFTRHLKACPGRSVTGRTVPGLTLSVAPPWAGTPWFLFVEIPARAAFGVLDEFLRRIWLECCGHLSWFDYPAHLDIEDDWDPFDLSTNPGIDISARIEEYLAPGISLRYTYDAGSSTELTVRCVEERKISAEGRPVRLLARNLPPELLCNCGKPATDVCAYCYWGGEAFLCPDCREDHECGEEAYLPVVDSPRTGVCGYTGPAKDP